VIDWKQSLPQIIAAVIGSGLIVTAFSTIGSLIFRPIIDISVVPYPTDKNVQNMKYAISLKNIGYAPATHLRLTMSYPGVYLIRTIMNHEDENITVESERTSVVAFLPRVTSGGSISINAIVYRPSMPVNASAYSLSDFGSNIRDYSYPHYEPYSIIATYDQGSSKYNPPFFLVNDNTIDYRSSLNSNVGLPLILIALAFLFFGIAFRHKRRSKSRLASDILEDIMKVRDELTNDDKGHPSGIILRLHAWQSNTENERQIFSDYRDYQKIDDFYSAVTSRNCYLLQNQVSNDILDLLNKDCVNKATVTYTEIDWRKFHKLDLVLLIPATILGSLFITIVPIVLVYQIIYHVMMILHLFPFADFLHNFYNFNIIDMIALYNSDINTYNPVYNIDKTYQYYVLPML